MAADADPPVAPEPAPEGSGRSSRRWWWIGGGAVLVAVAAFLAIAVFGVHTLFFDDEVDEAGPEFASGAELTTPPSTTTAPATTEAAGPTAEADPTTTTTTAPAEPVVTVAGTGTFVAVDHPGEGTVNLLTDGTQTFVRFEDGFSTDNGPDLFTVVYVGGERIELGRLKGNVGAQNYELPPDIDPASVDVVAVWCKRFDSTFTEAPITPI